MAMMLYGIMKHVGPFTIRAGLISGAFIWFGFVATTMAANYAFQGRKPMLTVIDADWLAVLLLIGAILGALGGWRRTSDLVAALAQFVLHASASPSSGSPNFWPMAMLCCAITGICSRNFCPAGVR